MARTVIAVLIAVSLAFAGCASSTVIQSEPSGAQLRIDGQPVGGTPVTFTDPTVWLWTQHQVTLEASGYQTLHSSMNAQPAVLYIVLGFLCLLPFFLVGELKPTYYYVLGKAQTARLVGQALEEAAPVQFR